MADAQLVVSLDYLGRITAVRAAGELALPASPRTDASDRDSVAAHRIVAAARHVWSSQQDAAIAVVVPDLLSERATNQLLQAGGNKRAGLISIHPRWKLFSQRPAGDQPAHRVFFDGWGSDLLAVTDGSPQIHKDVIDDIEDWKISTIRNWVLAEHGKDIGFAHSASTTAAVNELWGKLVTATASSVSLVRADSPTIENIDREALLAFAREQWASPKSARHERAIEKLGRIIPQSGALGLGPSIRFAAALDVANVNDMVTFGPADELAALSQTRNSTSPAARTAAAVPTQRADRRDHMQTVSSGSRFSTGVLYVLLGLIAGFGGSWVERFVAAQKPVATVDAIEFDRVRNLADKLQKDHATADGVLKQLAGDLKTANGSLASLSDIVKITHADNLKKLESEINSSRPSFAQLSETLKKLRQDDLQPLGLSVKSLTDRMNKNDGILSDIPGIKQSATALQQATQKIENAQSKAATKDWVLEWAKSRIPEKPTTVRYYNKDDKEVGYLGESNGKTGILILGNETGVNQWFMYGGSNGGRARLTLPNGEGEALSIWSWASDKESGGALSALNGPIKVAKASTSISMHISTRGEPCLVFQNAGRSGSYCLNSNGTMDVFPVPAK